MVHAVTLFAAGRRVVLLWLLCMQTAAAVRGASAAASEVRL
jgi:hypothetical protein